MGRVEKLVVLVVLFAITAILVISMNTRSAVGTPEEASLVGLDERHERWSALEEEVGLAPAAEDEPPAEPPDDGTQGRTQAPASEGSAAEKHAAPVLLSSETADESAADNAAPAAPPREIPADWDLLTLDDLAETLDPATMLHTCRAGETFESLATRYYGDAAKADLLQRNNEGVRRLDAGRTIFVPVREDEPVAKGTDYTVQDGDNLWGIAKKVYGKGSRWEEIYDANGTLLRTPDSLRAGMVLRIP